MKISLSDLEQIFIESRKVNVQGAVVERSDLFHLAKQSLKTNIIKVFTGFRRVGKSFLLKNLAKHIENELKVPHENIFFVNFELDRLSEINAVKDLRHMFDLYNGNIPREGPVYVFLDEIQNINKWESFVRALYEQGGYQIFLSGSNSKLLSSELGTALSGRYVDFYVSPFNYHEYMKYLGKEEVLESASYLDFVDWTGDLYRSVMSFIRQGGLPESLLMERSVQHIYIKNLLNKVIVDDITARRKIRNVKSFENLFKFLTGNVSGITSSSKLGKALNISPATVLKYIEYFENAYAIASLPRFSWKLYSVFEETDKHYLVDNALFAVANQEVKADRMLENTVYSVLKREFPDNRLFFGRDDKGKEVDFLVEDGDKEFLKIQVVHTLTDNNFKREIGNLRLANKYLRGPNFLILNQDLRTEKGEIEGVEMVLITELLVKGGDRLST